MAGMSKLLLKESYSGEGVSCIVWDASSQHLLTAGPDGRVLVHDCSSTSGPTSTPKVQHDHTAAITALAISPSGNFVATASLDHAVKLYSYPGLKFQSNVTRFTLPTRAVAFSSTGGLLAAAGDDDGIKLISTVDCAIVRVLKGHDSPVLGLAFDPKNEYMASSDSDGTVIFWAVTGKRMHTLDRAAPNSDANLPGRNQIAWHPDGRTLAVPGRKADVVLYDRDTAQRLGSLKGGHAGDVAVLAWSPNGKYLASAGKDRKVMLWDVETRQDLDSLKFDHPVCGVAWRPSGNALAVIDTAGKYGVWDGAVPVHMMSPTADLVQSTAMVDREALLNFGDDVEDVEEEKNDGGGGSGMACSLSDSEDEFPRSRSDKSSFQVRKFLKRKIKKEAEAEEVSAPASPEGLKLAVGSERRVLQQVDVVAMQAPFQPGSTKQVPGKRRFLAYSMMGSITSLEKDGLSHIEVEFHDTSTGTRVPAMTDYFGFTMAALCIKGCVLANPRKGDKNPSTLLYRPFNSWANNSEWSVRFQQDEEVKAVAIGSGWAAAVTSLNMLRIFSETGLQRFVMSISGPVVTLAGHEQLLAVVTHGGRHLSSGDQVMHFSVYDVHEQRRTVAGRLPLSSDATLSWIGFSESGHLGCFDSQGILRVYKPDFDGCWIPLFSAVVERKSGAESYWMVGLNDTHLFCVICQLPEVEPQVAPRPVLSVLNLSLPLVHSDLGADNLENEYLRNTLLLSQARVKADEAASTGEEDEELEDKVLKMKAELDKCILRLIAAACKGDKLARAMELATMLSLHKSMEGALKLVTALRLPALAERLSQILEGRLDAEKAEASDGTVADGGRSAQAASRPPSFSSLHQGSLGLKAALDLAPPSKPPTCLQASSSKPPSNPISGAQLSEPSTHLGVALSTCREGNLASTPALFSTSSSSSSPASSSVPASASSNPFRKANNPFAKQGTAAFPNTSVTLLDSIKRMQSTASDSCGKRKAASASCSEPVKVVKLK